MAFIITGITIPSIVNISRLKGLCVLPNGRTSHSDSTPTLGGIAVFVGLVMSTIILAGTYFDFELKYIIAGLIIVFFIGIKDDILIIDPWKKLAGQLLASGLIVVFAGIRITNLYGLFNIYNLPHFPSILLTVFVLVVIINGFNLIDGIDGLASGIGILTSSVFGIWFWKYGDIAFTLLSFSIVGSLAAFFFFNVFGVKNKIFLGDTGSLVTGFVVGLLACRFLQLELLVQDSSHIPASPAVAFGILIVPLYDSLRVFILRIAQGKSPFKADRQHIHHRLLQLGITHLQATLILIFINLFFIVLSYSLKGIGIIWLMSVLLGLASLMSYLLLALVKERTKELTNYYSFTEIWKEVYKMKKRIGRHPKSEIILNSPEKIHTDLN
jgi:UDP-GlcNAc:undecaprenyl-phosphate GlcNAc-1-phosphate transferase